MQKKYIAAGAAATLVALIGFAACAEDPTTTTTAPTPTPSTTAPEQKPDPADPEPLFDADAIAAANTVCIEATEASQAAADVETFADIHVMYEVTATGYEECASAMRATLPTIQHAELRDAVEDIADTAQDVADWAGAGWPGTDADIAELVARVEANTDAFRAGTRVARTLTGGEGS